MPLQNGCGFIVAHTSEPDEKCIFFIQTNVVVYVFDTAKNTYTWNGIQIIQ